MLVFREKLLTAQKRFRLISLLMREIFVLYVSTDLCWWRCRLAYCSLFTAQSYCSAYLKLNTMHCGIQYEVSCAFVKCIRSLSRIIKHATHTAELQYVSILYILCILLYSTKLNSLYVFTFLIKFLKSECCPLLILWSTFCIIKLE